MAPFWAQANAATPITKNKRAALAAKDVPIASRNQREIFKMSSRQALPYIILNPEAGEKLYGMVQNAMVQRVSCASFPRRRSANRTIVAGEGQRDRLDKLP
jgi:hypothetical protein